MYRCRLSTPSHRVRVRKMPKNRRSRKASVGTVRLRSPSLIKPFRLAVLLSDDILSLV